MGWRQSKIYVNFFTLLYLIFQFFIIAFIFLRVLRVTQFSKQDCEQLAIKPLAKNHISDHLVI